jgi:uncharacterized membrane protein
MTGDFSGGFWLGMLVGFVVGMCFIGVGLTIVNQTYIDGQIDALSGNKIIVEKVENERGELVWQIK